MAQKIDGKLIELAHDVLECEKQISLEKGSDHQGELSLLWNDDDKFEAHLTVYSEEFTYPGNYFDPPETVWNEEEDYLEANKIQSIADWLASDWGFDLCE